VLGTCWIRLIAPLRSCPSHSLYRSPLPSPAFRLIRHLFCDYQLKNCVGYSKSHEVQVWLIPHQPFQVECSSVRNAGWVHGGAWKGVMLGGWGAWQGCRSVQVDKHRVCTKNWQVNEMRTYRLVNKTTILCYRNSVRDEIHWDVSVTLHYIQPINQLNTLWLDRCSYQSRVLFYLLSLSWYQLSF